MLFVIRTLTMYMVKLYLIICFSISFWGIAQNVEITSLDKPVDLSGVWKFKIGDDLSWAEPNLDDTDWAKLKVPLNWGKQGYDDYAGFAWYRLNLTFLNPELPLDQLSVTIGKVHSAYELYIGGELVGGVGSLPPNPQIRYDQYKTYRIPSEAINSQGHLTLAIRVWRSTVIQNSWEGGLYEAPLLLGISDQLNQNTLQRLYTSLFLVIFYFLIGFYHIFLYWHSKSLDEYLWFGLLTISISVQTFMTSQLPHATQLNYILLTGITHPLKSLSQTKYSCIYLSKDVCRNDLFS